MNYKNKYLKYKKKYLNLKQAGGELTTEKAFSFLKKFAGMYVFYNQESEGKKLF